MADGKNLYETVIVTSAKLGEEGSAELVGKFKSLIERHGGTVQSVDDWGKRRFAYPIQKETEGYYTLINFESAPELTAELDRRYQITDGILRTIIIKRDPRHENAQKPVKPQKAEENIDVEAIAVEAVDAAPETEAAEPVVETVETVETAEEVEATEEVAQTPAETSEETAE